MVMFVVMVGVVVIVRVRVRVRFSRRSSDITRVQFTLMR